VVAVVVAVASTAFFSMKKTPIYTAVCKIAFEATAYDPTDPNSKAFNNIGGLPDHAEFIKSPEVGMRAAEILDLPASEVVGHIADVQLLEGGQTFVLTASSSPEPTSRGWARYAEKPGMRSADICNTHMQAYREANLDAAEAWYRKLLKDKKAQRTALRRTVERKVAEFAASGETEVIAAFERDQALYDLQEVSGKVNALENVIENGIDGGGRIVETSGGGVKQGGNLRSDMTLGLIVGLLFGIGWAMVREYMDDTVRDKESAQRELGIPVLAALPTVDSIDGLDEPSTGTIEAARNLRSTLSSLGFPHDKRMLVVTSTLTKRRSTTLASLAAAVAESGRSVLVIGSDLRSCRTHEAFGIANTVGLANVIRGQVPFEKAIRPAPGIEGVYVMPSGPVIGNPGELLSSEAMALTLRRAVRWADVVLLDAPPVLAAADSSILGAYADGVLLVVSAGQTNRAQASEAKEQLVAAGARVLGAVLVGSPEQDKVEDLHDEFGGGFGSWGGYGSGPVEGVYGGEMYNEDWSQGSVLTMTAYADARPSRPRSQPAKKTAASRAGQRSRAERGPVVPKAGVRTARANGSRANGSSARAASPKRKTTSSASKTAASKTAARGSTAKRTTTARARTAAKPRTSGTRSASRTRR